VGKDAKMFRLAKVDISELDFQNVGVWPALYKAILCATVFMAILLLAYFFHVKGLYTHIDTLAAKEVSLRQNYQEKALQAANFDEYRQQMRELEESFSLFLTQLPTDTEVPSLLEDITEIGYGSNLDITSIVLQPEQIEAFYVRLPIKIVAEGSYHHVGAFVSSVSSLPRIVTLHDYSMKANKASGRLVFEIQAQTYRYKMQSDE